MKRAPNFWILALFLLSVAAMVATASAQPPGGRGGRGPGGGPGGFGGGFMGRGGGGPGGGVLGLLRAELVQTELGLNEATLEKVRSTAEEAMSQGRDAFRGMGNFREMSEEERTKAFEQMRAQMEERTKKLEEAIRGIIGDQKFKRLKELELQLADVEALRRPEVLAYLGVDDAKKAKIEAAFEANRESMREMFSGARDMSEEQRAGLRDKMTGLRDKLRGEVMGLLSDGEKQKLVEMMGTPYAKIEELREQMRGGFGRGGDRGGRGPGGRGGDEGGGRPRRPAT